MLRRLRVYLSVLRTRIRSVAHFRANLIAWVLYSPLQLGVVYLVWKLIFRNSGKVGDFAFHDMILYYLLIHFLGRVLGSVQTVNYEVWSEINKGKLDIYLARPISFGPFVFFRSLGAPVVDVLVGVPFFVLASLLLGLPLQTNPAVLAAFLASALAGYTILFLVQLIVGSLTFWMERIFSIRDIVASFTLLFSGQLLPVSVLPGWVGKLSHYLPFEGIYFVPATIYARPQVDLEVASFLLQQGMWIAALLTLSAVVWSRGVTRYASQGG